MTSEEKVTTADDGVDLGEILVALWVGKFRIAIVVVFFVVFALAYAISSSPQFRAKSVFEVKSAVGSGNLSAQLGGLASLAGIDFGSSSEGTVLVRLAGRDFMERLSKNVGLTDDPFFAASDTSVLSVVTGPIRDLMLGGTNNGVLENDVLDDVFQVYSEAVSVTATSKGVYEVTVTHEDPTRAAEIANAIVAQLASEITLEKRAEDYSRLDYLSQQLAEAATLVESTTQAVAEFALANSLSATGAFAQRSEEIYRLNEQIRRSEEMLAAVREIIELLQVSEVLEYKDYTNLRRRHPILDDVEFRRLLGTSESLTRWEWPRLGHLSATVDVLNERVARSSSRLIDLNREAERYAESSKKLITLKRDATVAEATYKVLMEQVKAHSLASGYQAESVRVYQSATPPPKAFAPQKVLIVVLGIVFGGFFGAVIVLARMLMSGVLYTQRAVSDTLQPSLDVRMPFLRTIQIDKRKGLQSAIDDISASVGFVDLHTSWKSSDNCVVFFACLAKGEIGLPIALTLAERVSALKRSAVVVLGGQVPQFLAEQSQAPSSMLRVYPWSQSIDILHLPDANRSFTAESVSALLASSDYDCVMVVASDEMIGPVGRVLPSEKSFVAAVSQPGSTTRQAVYSLRAAVNASVNISVS